MTAFIINVEFDEFYTHTHTHTHTHTPARSKHKQFPEPQKDPNTSSPQTQQTKAGKKKKKKEVAGVPCWLSRLRFSFWSSHHGSEVNEPNWYP